MAKQFTVGDTAKGDDFSSVEIEGLVYKLAHWFASPECNRKYPEPVEAAKKLVRECLLAEDATGSAWKSCPAAFHTRIKIKCGFDMENDRGIYTARMAKTTGKHRRELAPDAEKKARAAMTDVNLHTAAAAKFDRDGFRKKIEEDILTSFPELDNPVHIPNVRSLSGMYAERENIDAELSIGTSSAVKRELLLTSLKKVEDMADGTMRKLGVHPDQVRKKISDKAASSVSDLVTIVDADRDFAPREKQWALQAALQLYWMSQHHNGAKTGPQLHDFEIWHLTRNRPCKFKCRCGVETTVVEGFEPEELRKYLVDNGVLVEEPIFPTITPAKALKGLATAKLRK